VFLEFKWKGFYEKKVLTVMVNNSNNINTKKTVTDDVVNPGPGLGQAQKVVGLNRLMGPPLPPTLDLNSYDNKINNNLSL
jgi:hypothetical protein